MLGSQSCRRFWVESKHGTVEYECRTLNQRNSGGANLIILQHLEIGAMRFEAAIGSLDVRGAVYGHGNLAWDHRARRIVLAAVEITLDELHFRRFLAAGWVMLDQHRRDPP